MKNKIISSNLCINITSIFLFALQFISISALSILQFKQWDLTIWDFGFFAQAMYLIGEGQINPFSSYLNNPFIKDHLAFSTYPISLISKLFGVQVSLLIQSASLTLGGFLIYRVLVRKIYEQELGAKVKIFINISLLIAIVFYPWTYWGAAFDFHPDSITCLFTAIAVWAFSRNFNIFYWIAIVIALLVKDGSSFIIICLGLILFFERNSIKKSLVTLLLGFLGLIISQFLVKTSAAGGVNGEGVHHFVQMYGYLGNTPKEIIVNCLLNPLLPLKMLSEHYVFFIAILAPLGFVLLFSIWGIIPFFIIIVLMYGLSNVTTVFDARYYYVHPILPLLFYGTGLGMIKFARYLYKKSFKKLVFVIPSAVIVLSVYWAYSWLPSLPNSKLLTSSETSASFREAARLIPPDVQVLRFNVTGEGYEPRQHEYMIRTNTKIPLLGEECYALLNPLVGKDGQSSNQQISELIKILKQPGSSVLYHDNGVWLIKFPISEKYIEFNEPDNVNYVYPSWALRSNVGVPKLSNSIEEWHVESNLDPGYIVYGPYQKLMPGKYEAKASLSIENSSDIVVNVEVWDSQQNKLLGRKELTGDVNKSEIVVPFELDLKDSIPYNAIQGPIGAKIITVPPSQAGNPIEIRIWTNGSGITKVYWTAISTIEF